MMTNLNCSCFYLQVNGTRVTHCTHNDVVKLIKGESMFINWYEARKSFSFECFIKEKHCKRKIEYVWPVDDRSRMFVLKKFSEYVDNVASSIAIWIVYFLLWPWLIRCSQRNLNGFARLIIRQWTIVDLIFYWINYRNCSIVEPCLKSWYSMRSTIKTSSNYSIRKKSLSLMDDKWENEQIQDKMMHRENKKKLLI